MEAGLLGMLKKEPGPAAEADPGLPRSAALSYVDCLVAPTMGGLEPPTSATQNVGPPWLGVNPDGWDGAALRVVKHAPWITPDEWAVEGPPRWLLACIQHELLATGAPAARYAVLIAGASLKTGEMGPVPEFQADLLAAEGAFFKALEDGSPPAPTTDDDIDVVKRLWPDDDGREIALPPEAWRVWEGVKGARKVSGQAKKRQRLLEARLRYWMGAAKVARIGRFRLGLRVVKTPNGQGRRLVEVS